MIRAHLRPNYLDTPSSTGPTWNARCDPFTSYWSTCTRQPLASWKPDDTVTGFGPLLKRDHGQIAVGFEWGTVHEGGSESTFILEGQALVGQGPERLELLSLFQRDVLLVLRAREALQEPSHNPALVFRGDLHEHPVRDHVQDAIAFP